MQDLNFSSATVLVIGDVMLDKYYYGGVSRISPEAPVPVVNVDSESSTLGGAGNVINNVSSLGAKGLLVAAATDDANRARLSEMLDAAGADYSFIDIGAPTTAKLRVIGGKQQIVRLDFEEIKTQTAEHTKMFKTLIDERLKHAAVAVISDYGKGVCSPEVCRHVITESAKQNKPVIVDPKGSDWTKYYGAFIITPNVKELSEAFGEKVPNTDEKVLEAGNIVRTKFGIKYLITTRSEKGVTIIADNYCKHFSAEARDVFDVSGAGDTVVATIASALAAGYCIEDAVSIANTSAGIVVGKMGTAPIRFAELSHALGGFYASKLVLRADIEAIVKRERLSGKTIVFTNGCFDILHRGHVTYLKKARALGDILILGLNSDASVKRLKGETRPLNSELDRAAVLEALEAVDFIVIFEEDTPTQLIGTIRPDILVKGGDYKAEDVAGREFASEVAIIDFVDGYSTTCTIKKMDRGNKK